MGPSIPWRTVTLPGGYNEKNWDATSRHVITCHVTVRPPRLKETLCPTLRSVTLRRRFFCWALRGLNSWCTADAARVAGFIFDIFGGVSHLVFSWRNKPELYVEPSPVRLYNGLYMACKPQFLRGQHPLGKSVHNRMPVGSASILVVEPMGKPTFPPGKPHRENMGKTNKHCGQPMDQWIGFKTNLNQKAWLFTSKFAMVLSAGFTPCPNFRHSFLGLAGFPCWFVRFPYESP